MKIRETVPEKNFIEKIYKDFHKNRAFYQSIFYFEEGADNYYKLNTSKTIKKPNYEEYYSLIKKNCLKTNKKFGFISLGCGNSEAEKEILERFIKDGYDFNYLGVDTSFRMLDLAKKNLSGLNKDQSIEFLSADFGSEEFKHSIKNFLVNVDYAIYAFLGNTFGNVEQAYMADVLNSLLNKEDYLWLDVEVREGTEPKHDFRLFNRYQKYIEKNDRQSFYFSPLKRIGIKLNDGELYLEMNKETPLNALKFSFGFKYKKNKVTKYLGEKMFFIPDDSIYLQNIRVYDKKALVKFIEARNLTYIDELVDGTLGWFLFKKD